MAPSDVFGVAEGIYPTNRLCYDGRAFFNCDDRSSHVFGTFEQMLADVAALGAGHIRRVQKCDLLWGSLFPEDPGSEDSFQYGIKVPAPSDILEMLRAGNYGVLAHFHSFLLVCLAHGLKVTVTPFNAGGGAKLTFGDQLPSTSPGPVAGVTWAEIDAGRPSHHDGLRLPSLHGWERFYWDHPGGTTAERNYQRFDICVWPTRADDTSPPASAYMRECARRKSLGIAAFAEGIAEYLLRVNRAWQLVGASIYDVIEFVETGNELDGVYAQPAVQQWERLGARPSDLAARDLNASYSAAEAGRYVVLVAAPIRRALPAMRFRAPELLSWKPVVPHSISEPSPPGSGECLVLDTFIDRVEWLRAVIEQGVTKEIEDARALQSDYLAFLAAGGLLPLNFETLSWWATCSEAGYFWPPLPSSSRDLLSCTAPDLVHQVGFHFYHGYDHDPDGLKNVTRYADATRLAADVATLKSRIGIPLSALGFNLGYSVGEISFPAEYPYTSATVSVRAPFYEFTNERLQAAMLVRYLAVLLASGVSNAYWFCFSLPPMQRLGPLETQSVVPVLPSGGSMTRDVGGPVAHTFADWAQSSGASGLRNDVFVAALSSRGQFQAAQAYARSAWYSYRRLMWLTSLAIKERVRFALNERGLTIVRIPLRHGVAVGPDGERLGGVFRTAYLMWLDQYADSECLHDPTGDSPDDVGPRTVRVELSGPDVAGFALVFLVPFVTVDYSSTSVDANGYKAVSSIDWNWEGWSAAASSAEEFVDDSGSRFVALTLRICQPSGNPAPVCLFCNAEYVYATP